MCLPAFEGILRLGRIHAERNQSARNSLLLAIAGLNGSDSACSGRAQRLSQVLKAVGKSGDYKANVLRVNIPRNDLHVAIADYPVPTPFGFGGWFALTKGDGGDDVMMGDLVLLQEEVNPVMSALLGPWAGSHCPAQSLLLVTADRCTSCTFTGTARPWI